MTSHTGACAAASGNEAGLCDLYVTGRDSQNRSRIGRLTLDLSASVPRIIQIDDEPVLDLGKLGAFDDNGTSYPCVVSDGADRLMYYTGWTPTVTVPFQNHLGLARRQDTQQFERLSKAPILPRTDNDFLSIGSAYVLREDGVWRMWYTAFRAWGEQTSSPKHEYVIKYASSSDGICWNRDDIICIEGTGPQEHSICRPSVFKQDGEYHMIYCLRGEHYSLGYAVSGDGVEWERRDAILKMAGDIESWENQSQCYPWVFEHGSDRYLLYSGNDYGRGGLGIARQG